MAWSLFGDLRNLNFKKIIFLIKMAPLKIDSLNFANS